MIKGVADDDHAERLDRALRELHRANHEANVELARRLGLGLNDVHALDVLDVEGAVGPVGLAGRLGIRSASATALVDRLEAAGHVARVRDPQDRRRVAVVPTEHARQEAYTALAPLIAALDDAVQRLSPEERGVVAAHLERVAAAMRDYARGGPGTGTVG